MRFESVDARRASWPEGLSDKEATQRLRTLCLGACDGIQDLADDSRYRALRRALLNRADLRPVAPAFVAAQANLSSVVRHLRETKDRNARRDLVRAEFEPLILRVAGAAESASSAWTGRMSVREQAVVVNALAPTAMLAVQRLLDDEVRLLDNGGPVDPISQEALSHLRMLHEALGELIELAEREGPLEGVLGKLKSLQQSARVTLGRAAAATPVTASALVAFTSVVGIADMLVGNVVVSLAAGALAGNTVKDAMLKGDARAS